MLLGMLLLGVGTVQAQDIRPYAGMGLGAFGLELKNAGINGYNQKNTVFGGYLRLGADVNDYFGAEFRVGTTGSGTTNYPNGSIKLDAGYLISYLAKVQYPFTPDFRLYGMLGATTAKLNVSVSVINPGTLSAADSATKTGFSYGVGGEFMLDNNLSLGAEWMQYWTDVDLGVGFTGRLWSAVGTLNYAF
ncbi:MAG: porin family protein, partial [Zetaproteobacteria bacterium]